jgi:hypothetical protein
MDATAKARLLVKLDDSALIARRRETRTALERDPDEALHAIYDATTREIATCTSGKSTGGGNAA